MMRKRDVFKVGEAWNFIGTGRGERDVIACEGQLDGPACRTNCWEYFALAHARECPRVPPWESS